LTGLIKGREGEVTDILVNAHGWALGLILRNDQNCISHASMARALCFDSEPEMCRNRPTVGQASFNAGRGVHHVPMRDCHCRNRALFARIMGSTEERLDSRDESP
jgi:hypothetical protein